jgi:hypothetical protein
MFLSWEENITAMQFPFRNDFDNKYLQSMRNLFTAFFLSVAVADISAQAPDTTKVLSKPTETVGSNEVHVPAINQEIGVNIVSLLSQLSVFTTTNVQQLPFDVFYNLYIKDKVGLRFGTGFSSSFTSDEPSDSIVSNTVRTTNNNYRFGISVNFMHYKHLTFNLFGDFFTEKHLTETISTTTTQTFPNPFIKRKITNTVSQTGNGLYMGIGVKYNIHRNLALYTEIPFIWEWGSSSVETFSQVTGLDDDLKRSARSTFVRKNLLPVTIYLVLRF